MLARVAAQQTDNLIELIRLERRAFAARMRIARAILGWSQCELAARIGLTQRAVHKLEQGDTGPRRTTVLAIEATWLEQGLAFEDTADGGFRVTVRPALLDQPRAQQARRRRGARSAPHQSSDRRPIYRS